VKKNYCVPENTVFMYVWRQTIIVPMFMMGVMFNIYMRILKKLRNMKNIVEYKYPVLHFV
jgi:hypothetical protein